MPTVRLVGQQKEEKDTKFVPETWTGNHRQNIDTTGTRDKLIEKAFHKV